MGRPGPRSKESARRMRRNGTEAWTVVRGRKLDDAKPKSSWLKQTKDAWAAYWESDVAAIVRPEHVSTLVRLFDLKDDEERFRREARKEPYLTGSQGQQVLNPAGARADRLLPEIRHLEATFAMNPEARAKLGLSLNDADADTLDDLNAAIDGDLTVIDLPPQGSAARLALQAGTGGRSWPVVTDEKEETNG